MAQNTGDHFKKNMAFPEGNKLFPGDFLANLDEINADMVQFTKRWNWEWIVSVSYDNVSTKFLKHL